MVETLAVGGLGSRQEGHELKVSLGCLVRLCLKKQQQQQKNKWKIKVTIFNSKYRNSLNINKLVKNMALI